MQAKDLILQLKLITHPEGGFYRETYRAQQTIVTAEGKNRQVSTAIYYLLENEDRSLFHRIRSDELWFFHQGQTLEIVLIQNKQLEVLNLGHDIEQGEVPQAIIPANTWFAARIKKAAGFALVSCTVAPGFDFTDFELADRATLLSEFPHLKESIEQFT